MSDNDSMNKWIMAKSRRRIGGQAKPELSPMNEWLLNNTSRGRVELDRSQPDPEKHPNVDSGEGDIPEDANKTINKWLLKNAGLTK